MRRAAAPPTPRAYQPLTNPQWAARVPRERLAAHVDRHCHINVTGDPDDAVGRRVFRGIAQSFAAG
jgi:hypothetical protein